MAKFFLAFLFVVASGKFFQKVFLCESRMPFGPSLSLYPDGRSSQAIFSPVK
jgi:hypothetical protein